MTEENKKKFQQYLIKQKKKSLLYSILLLISLVVVAVFIVLNIQYKDELEAQKQELKTQNKKIQVQKDSIKKLAEGLESLAEERKKYLDYLYKQESFQTQIENVVDLHWPQLNQYKIGCYYYKDDGVKAESILAFLQQKGFNGTYELYPRNEEFFQKVQQAKGYEIRYEPSTENDDAFELKAILDTWNKEVKFDLRPVKNSTPNFISIFIPPGK